MNLLIGIDWSQDHHDVCIMNEKGATIVRFEFDEFVTVVIATGRPNGVLSELVLSGAKGLHLSERESVLVVSPLGVDKIGYIQCDNEIAGARKVSLLKNLLCI